MNIMRIGAVLALGVAMSGCATIIEGTTQSVSVNSTPENGAACTLKNSEGTWYLTTPGSTTVHKTKNDMTVDCTKDGFGPAHVVAISHFGGTTAANVIAGGVIGLGVDAASGANYHYDSPITVTMTPSSAPSSAPTASAPPAPNAAPATTAPATAGATAPSSGTPAASPASTP